MNIPNFKGKTALHTAIEEENYKMIQTLIHNGEDTETSFSCERCYANFNLDASCCAPKPFEHALEMKKIVGMKSFLYATN